MFGSSVNVTCTAVSYPKANPDTDYGIQHPAGVTKDHHHITHEMDGIIYEIDSAANYDNGTYQCHLRVICMGEEITGQKEGYLIVTNKTSKTFVNDITVQLYLHLHMQ